MEEERFRDVGLFRYSLIRPMLDPACSNVERGALVRAVAAEEHTGPGGERLTAAPLEGLDLTAELGDPGEVS